MIASDVNNPEFHGQRDPDSALSVQFYVKPVKDDYKTEQEKRPIFFDVDFVKICTPGNTLNIIDTPARDDHKQRFPRQWNAFKSRVGETSGVSGTPVTEWPRLSASQAEELKALKFYTVESIAGAGDAQLQGIGMIAGQSVFAFRDDAKRFLMVADAAAKMSEADKKLEEAKAEIAQKEAAFASRMEAMQAQIEALVAAASEKHGKAGRKPKQTDEEPETPAE